MFVIAESIHLFAKFEVLYVSVNRGGFKKKINFYT